MNPQRLSVRFRVGKAPDDLEPAIGTFHRFIQRGRVEGLSLDVADYRHVPKGPGVLLVGHDIDYGVNEHAFTVVRKRSAADDAATQLRDALRMGLGALDAIEDDGALALSVDRSRFTVSAVDRRLGSPADVERALHAEVEPVVADLYGDGAIVTTVEIDDPRRAPELFVEVDPAVADQALEKLGGAQAPGQSPWDISVEELARLRESEAEFLLLDVREESELDTVTLGGKHLPLASISERLDELERDAHIIVHCRAGTRGAKAVTQLREAGFDNAWNVNGGLMAWADRIDPSLPRY